MTMQMEIDFSRTLNRRLPASPVETTPEPAPVTEPSSDAFTALGYPADHPGWDRLLRALGLHP